MPYSTNLRFAVFKQESTPGTAEFDLASTHPADADFDLRIYEPEISPTAEPDDENAKFATGDHGEYNAIIGANSAQITFGLKIGWAGDTVTFPNASKAFQMAGLTEVTYTTTGVAWQPKKAGDDVTYTAAFYDIEIGGTPSGHAFLLKGCKANCVLGSDGIGAPLMGQFTVTGGLVDIVDVANGNLPTLTGADTTLPEKLLNVPVSVAAVNQCISSWSLDFGNDVQPIICQSDSTGYDYHYIASRRPRLSMNPQVQAVTTEDIHEDVNNETTKAINMQYGTNHVKVTVPRAQTMMPGHATREGLDIWEHNFRALRNNNGAGKADSDLDDEVTFEILIGARA